MAKLDWTCSGTLVALAMIVGCGGKPREDDIAEGGLSLVTLDGGGQGGSADDGDDGDDGGDDAPSADEGTGAAGTDDADAMQLDTKWDVGGGASGGPAENGCLSDPLDDMDGDGFTEADGDCNDCDANVNPGAIEVQITEPDRMGNVPDPADEDCDGLIDNVAPPCDGAFALDDANPFNAAAAMDLCKVATGPNDWGVVSASWVRANGAPGQGATPQFGILNNFGPNVAPQGGSQMLVLSSGRARLPNQAGNCMGFSCPGVGGGTAPAGFPQNVPSCPVSNSIFDDIALEVVVRAPTNATGFAYNFDFYSFEYPEWVCDLYNDQYIALMNPAPPGAINGNISFDSLTNPVSVNIAFFDVCWNCPLGTAELSQTGFDTWNDAGATSWLVTTAPVVGGQEFTLRFAIWDTGDTAYDSTVLLDGFRWIADGGTVTLGTEPEG